MNRTVNVRRFYSSDIPKQAVNAYHLKPNFHSFRSPAGLPNEWFEPRAQEVLSYSN